MCQSKCCQSKDARNIMLLTYYFVNQPIWTIWIGHDFAECCTAEIFLLQSELCTVVIGWGELGVA